MTRVTENETPEDGPVQWPPFARISATPTDAFLVCLSETSKVLRMVETGVFWALEGGYDGACSRMRRDRARVCVGTVQKFEESRLTELSRSSTENETQISRYCGFERRV